VFEYASGGELFEYVKTRTQLPEDVSVDGLGQIIKAIAFLHGAGYAHRDLKPENVLLFKNINGSGGAWTWKITDFDFAKELDRDSEWCSTVCGTPGWSPPEILEMRAGHNRASSKKGGGAGRYVGRAVDVWGVGMIAYYCLGGYRAFEHGFDEDTGVRLLEFHPERWGRVSERCVKFCRSTLERDYLRRTHWKNLKKEAALLLL
jgi:serine/threonine protein kinase